MTDKTDELMRTIAEIRNAFGVFTLESLGTYIDKNYVHRSEFEEQSIALDKALRELEALKNSEETELPQGMNLDPLRQSGAI